MTSADRSEAVLARRPSATSAGAGTCPFRRSSPGSFREALVVHRMEGVFGEVDVGIGNWRGEIKARGEQGWRVFPAANFCLSNGLQRGAQRINQPIPLDNGGHRDTCTPVRKVRLSQQWPSCAGTGAWQAAPALERIPRRTRAIKTEPSSTITTSVLSRPSRLRCSKHLAP